MKSHPLYDKTLEFLSILKENPNLNESEYRQILDMLCDLILHEDPDKINKNLTNKQNSTKICSSCGESLESWENDVCGPCRLHDSRFTDEISD